MIYWMLGEEIESVLSSSLENTGDRWQRMLGDM